MKSKYILSFLFIFGFLMIGYSSAQNTASNLKIGKVQTNTLNDTSRTTLINSELKMSCEKGALLIKTNNVGNEGLIIERNTNIISVEKRTNNLKKE